MNGLKNKTGFSLIEVLVATSLFVIIVTASLGVFKMVIDSQRSAIATQNVEESLKYFLEVTGKEIRMAKRNNGLCSGPSSTDIYYSVDNTLTFRNYHDQCVTYSLSSFQGISRFTITRDGLTDFITPAKINLDELNFVLRPEGGTNNNQPTVTMELVAHALGLYSAKSEIRIQTTLTSRYYLLN
ncbi:MAG: prepilin-type N-terminal cleavage/methylation domain-containing protein [Candidatus Falkowbacteria bacterium]